MRGKVSIGLAALVLGLCFSAQAKKQRRVPNMPRGWSWPPSAQMKTAGKTCLRELEELGVEFETAEATRKVATPITLKDMRLGEIELQSIFRKPPFVMDCHLALSLARAAPALRLIGITALRFTTIHEYRTIRRGKKRTKILSRHAIGLAMDVFEVQLADGTLVEIEDAYPDEPALLAAEQTINSRDDFRTVLSPGSDPRAHHDHFHFEARMPLSSATSSKPPRSPRASAQAP